MTHCQVGLLAHSLHQPASRNGFGESPCTLPAPAGLLQIDFGGSALGVVELRRLLCADRRQRLPLTLRFFIESQVVIQMVTLDLPFAGVGWVAAASSEQMERRGGGGP